MSELFEKTECVSLSSFATIEQPDMTRQMQIHLSYSCIELASYLGFPSQSHLVKLFHERYG